ncbi:Putative lipoprotein [Shigella boydii ATCC 9905]|nr:Putative lipoprotein [Shigella boydii ATCC 9905]
MKKLAIAGALMLLAGCAEVENYNNVVKTPAPDWLADQRAATCAGQPGSDRQPDCH